MTRGARGSSRRLRAVFGAVFLAVGCSRPPQEAEALALVERYDAAWDRRDWPVLEKVLAPDYVYFSSRGVRDRAATKALVTSGEYRLDRGDRRERKTYRSGSTVVVGSHWTGTGDFHGEPFTDDQRCSIVVAFADGKGRVLSEHCTNLPTAAGVVPANAF